MYEQYLIRLLAPLSLYNLRAPHNGGELAALGGELDSVSGLVELVERESLLATAESEGLDRREVLFAHKPAAVTQEDRREAIAALLRISEDGLTPEAINDTLTGCGIQSGGKGGRQPAGHISQNCRCAGGVRPDQKDYFGYSTLSFRGGVLLPLSDLGRM